ncbi:MAG: ornithine carbamoyltransferase [Clostridia bacterium]|nr:ornithine carbamoyltransferase [Clostridia bacterium]MDE7257323.1 ornithine carbamoyltransferase [Clostridia bacterium]
MDINRYSPSYSVNQKHMTRLADYSTEELFELLYATRQMKAKFAAHENTAILQGVTIALLFGDSSLRTRSALEIGIRQLGGESVNLPYSERDMRAGENIKDVVNVICRYGVGALITRGIAQSELDNFAEVSPIPVINSTNSDYVPMQALSDLYTIWERKKKLEGVKLAFIGKGTNVAASLLMGAVKCGMEVAVATPEMFNVKAAHLERAEQYGNITITDDPLFAAKNADVVYTDSYHYHSQLTKEEAETLAPYKVNNRIMAAAAGTAMFMHPLPARRGIEVSPEVIDGKQSIVYEQAENKLHAIKAILALLIK